MKTTVKYQSAQELRAPFTEVALPILPLDIQQRMYKQAYPKWRDVVIPPDALPNSIIIPTYQFLATLLENRRADYVTSHYLTKLPREHEKHYFSPNHYAYRRNTRFDSLRIWEYNSRNSGAIVQLVGITDASSRTISHFSSKKVMHEKPDGLVAIVPASSLDIIQLISFCLEAEKCKGMVASALGECVTRNGADFCFDGGIRFHCRDGIWKHKVSQNKMTKLTHFLLGSTYPALAL